MCPLQTPRLHTGLYTDRRYAALLQTINNFDYQEAKRLNTYKKRVASLRKQLFFVGIQSFLIYSIMIGLYFGTKDFITIQPIR
ncbi:uncharacterized protein with GYD domain [Parabacteroides sp. PFB2-12]|nr:uncharacterized protein with GYD domain [Parabacteroides sp. PM6-13]MDH6391536.1 uncharacterized protein with GYD domain [Parabacteroides sp. PFB2-12]